MTMTTICYWTGMVALAGFTSGALAQSAAEVVTGEAVTAGRESKGIVLLGVRWDRRWNCAGFENAQLRVIGFDKLPSTKTSDGDKADVVLDDAPRIMTKPVFDNYAFLVDPGEYGLSRIEIKVARSRSDVGALLAPRSRFLKDGQSLGGGFAVGAGEVVYIGHFYIDCFQQPTMWRFYPEGREAFNGYLTALKRIYPALDVDKVVFRLFQTKEFGNDYKLP